MGNGILSIINCYPVACQDIMYFCKLSLTKNNELSFYMDLIQTKNVYKKDLLEGTLIIVALHSHPLAKIIIKTVGGARFPERDRSFYVFVNLLH